MLTPENKNYPIPDPSWDYAEIWHRLQESRIQLECLLIYMADLQAADDSSDETVKTRITDITNRLSAARRLMG
ncbi:hypothetical protein [Iningainema tapete]|uniref:Uncharacterized protein n=1 Tax=Iningainema tapete BLCC-T55 TaxID=2748662 RepID=A0A8J7BW63_9CYAN|nr:hypothetical protein [Iningainema tapete]MBD2771197.1 hypothetical protein [Iningainema tapete BLCC-T55]